MEKERIHLLISLILALVSLDGLWKVINGIILASIFGPLNMMTTSWAPTLLILAFLPLILFLGVILISKTSFKKYSWLLVLIQIISLAIGWAYITMAFMEI